MTSVAELAALPATDEQIKRARQAAEKSPAFQAQLDVLLASDPTRGQITDFLGAANAQVDTDRIMAKLDAICRTVGIDQPTGSDRLMAMQIALLQEQNATLTRVINQMRANPDGADNSGSLTEMMGAAMLGAIAFRI